MAHDKSLTRRQQRRRERRRGCLFLLGVGVFIFFVILRGQGPGPDAVAPAPQAEALAADPTETASPLPTETATVEPTATSPLDIEAIATRMAMAMASNDSLATVPTETPVPTLPPTSTPVPTNTATAEPTETPGVPLEVQAYLLKVEEHALEMANALTDFGELATRPEFSNSIWVVRTAAQIVRIQQTSESFQKVLPPPGLTLIHVKIRIGFSRCADAATLYSDSVSGGGIDGMIKAAKLLGDCESIIVVTTRELESMDFSNL